MKTPQTVKQLNTAINVVFQVIECDRAYMEFPFKISANSSELHLTHRVVMHNIGLVGDEVLCCRQIWEQLTDCVTYEVLQDHCGMLLLRAPFVFHENKAVIGRLAFYNADFDKKLQEKRCCFKQGYIANEAIREES